MSRSDRESRVVAGDRLEAEVARIRSAWRVRQMEVELAEEMRELLGLLGVSEEWKAERVAELRRQVLSGELHPLVACEQIAFTQSLVVNR
ncbi:hypothetical protein ACWD3I_24945 [Streptomyces sp. NPDC002817]|uniref:hypothetical protein n=1 Tax=Streptomyces sp. NPDC088357 TaxID=3154655 RepID=UPI003425370E